MTLPPVNVPFTRKYQNILVVNDALGLHFYLEHKSVFLFSIDPKIAKTMISDLANVLPEFPVPLITLVGPNPQIVQWNGSYVELGAKAYSEKDGDISGSLIIVSSSVSPSVIGDYTVTYDVIDSLTQNAVQVTRDVKVLDNVRPVITLVGANPLSLSVGTAYTEPGATAADAHDGNITSSIKIDNHGVDTSKVGTFGVTYDVTDASGNPAIQVTRVVNVH